MCDHGNIQRRSGNCGGVHRKPIHECDRMCSGGPSASVKLYPDIPGEFSGGCEYLTCFQAGLGYKVPSGRLGRHGPEIEMLYAQGTAWLNGEPDFGTNDQGAAVRKTGTWLGFLIGSEERRTNRKWSRSTSM